MRVDIDRQHPTAADLGADDHDDYDDRSDHNPGYDHHPRTHDHRCSNDDDHHHHDNSPGESARRAGRRPCDRGGREE